MVSRVVIDVLMGGLQGMMKTLVRSFWQTRSC